MPERNGLDWHSVKFRGTLPTRGVEYTFMTQGAWRVPKPQILQSDGQDEQIAQAVTFLLLIKLVHGF